MCNLIESLMQSDFSVPTLIYQTEESRFVQYCIIFFLITWNPQHFSQALYHLCIMSYNVLPVAVSIKLCFKTYCKPL